MTAQCLSACGPPPHCGHVPTPERPVCAACVISHEATAERIARTVIDNAVRLLESHGYKVIPPTATELRETRDHSRGVIGYCIRCTDHYNCHSARRCLHGG